MVVVAIAAILTSLAVPALQATMERNQLDTVANQFVAAMSMARSEAVRAPDSKLWISMPAGNTSWTGGWQVTTLPTNAVAGTAPTTLQVAIPLAGKMTLNGNAATAGGFGFDAMGRLVTGVAGPQPALEFVLCADGVTVSNHSRAVIVSPSGRASIAQIVPSGTNAGSPVDETNAPITTCTP